MIINHDTFRSSYSPESLIEALCTHPRLHKLFSAPNGRLKESLSEHSVRVLGIYEKYFASSPLPAFFSANAMRLFLAMHDIGKPLGAKNGPEQHSFHVEVFDSIAKELPLSSQESMLIREMLADDLIGGYVQGYYSLAQATQKLDALSAQLNVSSADLLQIYTAYYHCDAGAYTTMSGGIDRLNFLFEESSNQQFVFDTKYHRFKMSDRLEQLFAKLAEHCNKPISP